MGDALGGRILLWNAFPSSSVRISPSEVVVFSGGSTGPGLSSEHPGKQEGVILCGTAFLLPSGED